MRGNLRMPRVPEEASQVRCRVVPAACRLLALCPCTGPCLQLVHGQLGDAAWPVMHPCTPTRSPTHSPTRSCAAQEAAELMEQCTRLDPEERPSAQEVMKRLHAMLAAQRSSARREAGL